VPLLKDRTIMSVNTKLKITIDFTRFGSSQIFMMSQLSSLLIPSEDLALANTVFFGTVSLPLDPQNLGVVMVSM
jgi:hypothetical protein